MTSLRLFVLLLTLILFTASHAAESDVIVDTVTATGSRAETTITAVADSVLMFDVTKDLTTLALTNLRTGPYWLLSPYTADTLDPSDVGMGWADGMFTLQTPVGALQFGETGDPEESVIYWPGRLHIGAIEADLVTADIRGNQIVSGIIPANVVEPSMRPPLRQWQDGALYAGANGLTYGTTGPAGTTEPTTPGRYYPVIDVTDGGTEAVNAVVGKIRSASQLRADLDLEVGVDVQAYNAATTTLGSSIDLATEVSGSLPVASVDFGAGTDGYVWTSDGAGAEGWEPAPAGVGSAADDLYLCTPTQYQFAWQGYAHALNIQSAATAGASIVVTAPAGFFFSGFEVPGGGRFDWAKRVTVAFAMTPIFNPQSDAKVWVGIHDGTATAANPFDRALGVLVEGLAVKAQIHNGTTLTTSSTLLTLSGANDNFRVQMQSDGSGSVVVYLNDTLVATMTGGPTAPGTSGWVCSARILNGATAATNRWQITPINVRMSAP